eukprot:SAG31_NODE_21727_length_542_cov_1.011287_1_plen_61_part_01
MVLVGVSFCVWSSVLMVLAACIEGVLGTTITEQWKEQRIALLIDGIKKYRPDVVCLQEVN